jgi:hypothetical protein
VAKSLDAAFRATTYRVFPAGEPPIDIRIGVASERLDALLAAQCGDTWAFITAWNPGAQPLPARENAARHAELLALLCERGLRTLQGSGIPSEPGWTAEESVLVVGIGKAEAIAIARRFGQVAVVTGARGAAAELVYC